MRRAWSPWCNQDRYICLSNSKGADLQALGQRAADRYPRTLAAWIYGYIAGELPPASADPEPDLTWLMQRVAQDAETAVRLISLTCVEALKQRPSVLLSESSAAAYLQSIEEIDPELVGLKPTFLSRILQCVLDAWISIANLRAIADLIELHKEKTAEELIQEIIAVRER